MPLTDIHYSYAFINSLSLILESASIISRGRALNKFNGLVPPAELLFISLFLCQLHSIKNIGLVSDQP